MAPTPPPTPPIAPAHSSQAETRASARAAPTLREWLREAPFALGMSSGFFGFFAHAGVMTVLEDEGLAPTLLTGSSAGALVAGLWASGLSARAIQGELLALRRAHFWDPAPGLGLLRGRLFLERVRALVPASTFEACRAPARLSVFDVLSRETRVLDRGPLAPAIVASCTLPFLFQPTWIDGRPLLDGGILDRPGLLGMPPGARVFYHHLAARSPWRRSGSAALAIPARENMVSLSIEGLPRVGPTRLEQGARALEAAQFAAKSAFDRPVGAGVIRI